MQRASGIGWVFIGTALFAGGLIWLVYQNQLMRVVPLDSSLPFIPIPRYGEYLLLIVGFFLILLGGRLLILAPGTLIVVAFVHFTLALMLFALVYVLVTFTTPWISTQLRYPVLIGISFLGLIQLIFAQEFYRSAQIDTTAASWQPFDQCEQCGRKKDSFGRCPLHDVTQVFARLVNEKTNQSFAVPLPGPSVVGTGNVDVVLDPADDPSYQHISQIHAEIRYEPERDEFHIIDLGSLNKTTVAGSEVGNRSTILLPDVTVKFGPVPFKFEIVKRTQKEIDDRAGVVFDA